MYKPSTTFTIITSKVRAVFKTICLHFAPYESLSLLKNTSVVFWWLYKLKQKEKANQHSRTTYRRSIFIWIVQIQDTVSPCCTCRLIQFIFTVFQVFILNTNEKEKKVETNVSFYVLFFMPWQALQTGQSLYGCCLPILENERNH